MAIQSLRNGFNGLLINDHEIDPSNMTPEMKKGIRDRRMKLYKLICYCGVAMVMWIDKAALLNSVYQYSHIAAQICMVYLTVALLSMLLGIIASSFPDSAPFAMAVAWNGTWQVFMFLIMFIHLSIVKVYPELLHLTVSFIFTSVLFSIYWSFCTRDPAVGLFYLLKFTFPLFLVYCLKFSLLLTNNQVRLVEAAHHE
ncbi:unnamed protein product [Urochloa decumbens]|uniref:Uncharacterized protein n=1 Tax=Urochloa decumbens TaxID=240449 RepID=A0ABC9HCR0_9POAL